MAMDMFIKIGSVEGEAVDHAHGGEIDVLDWAWGMTQSGSMHMGGGGGSGKVNVQDLTFKHYIDKATPNLMMMCCNGEHVESATFTVRKAGKSPVEYLIIEMQEVLVAGVQSSGAQGDERLCEEVTLNFGKCKVSYQPQKKDGSKDGGPVEMGWDIGANTQI